MQNHARGCLLGQFIGDSLGSIVEFYTEFKINKKFPNGVRELISSEVWHTLSGQITDDSEMALCLARTIIQHKCYDETEVLKSYQTWLNSNPFDCGTTTHQGLLGFHNKNSQANGALMRISPLGIFGTNLSIEDLFSCAEKDAKLTHVHNTCVNANKVFTLAISLAIRKQLPVKALYNKVLEIAKETLPANSNVLTTLYKAQNELPKDYNTHMGYVLIALQNAFYHLLHTSNIEEALVSTISKGGDTDTNAAICGALLGACHGMNSIPRRWIDVILTCKPDENTEGVYRPRPKCYWATDALELADSLLNI